MATARKKTTSKASKSTRSTKAKAAAKKTSAKKRKPAAKRSTKKTTAAARKRSTSTKRVRKTTSTAPKKELKPKTKSWWSVLTFSVIAVGMAVAGFLSLNPEMAQQIQANIVAQFNGLVQEDGSGTPTETETTAAVTSNGPQGGVLITWKPEGENELKLKEIFETVFPDTALQEHHYQSAEGQRLIEQWGVTEVPIVFYEQQAFENETLAEVVKDLFTLENGYYGLHVSLVNPSDQLHINTPISTKGAVVIGEENAPLDIIIYSDPKCQHCRVNEQNNIENFTALADEGIARLMYMDVPQTNESHHHSAALACMAQVQPDQYLWFRETMFSRPNISVAFTDNQLERLEVDLERDCDLDAINQMLRLRVREVDGDGITGVPAVYVRKTGENSAIRVTGAKNFSEYEALFDELLGRASAAELEEGA